MTYRCFYRYIACVVFLYFIGLLYTSSVVAQENQRNLPGIEIVTRAERGADESLRYTSLSREQRRQMQQESLEQLKETDRDAYMQRIDANAKTQASNDYLRMYYPDEQRIDMSYGEENGKFLITAISIKREKIKLIVHHTADSYSGLDTDEQVLQYLQRVYTFHARTRGWGDIGYNFLIAPDGKIYEGRAGGAGTVGMHTLRNNSPSVGISLMGNFEIEEPTTQQIDSLTRLLTALAKQYSIDPTQKAMYHRSTDTHPYLRSVENYTIAGHRDAGRTACPGTNLYTQLPFIRERVRKNLVMYALTSRKTGEVMPPIQTKFSVPGVVYAQSMNATITVPASFANMQECSFMDGRPGSVSCVSSQGRITLSIRSTEAEGVESGRRTVVLRDDRNNEFHVSFVIVRQDDLSVLANTAKRMFIVSNGSLPSKNPMQKIIHRITPQESLSLMQQQKKVLLYDVSTLLSYWNISCQDVCVISIDGETLPDTIKSVRVISADDTITVYIDDDTAYEGEQLRVTATRGLLEIENYDRKSFVGIPWNVFRGELLITQQQLQNLDTQQREDRVVVINNLSFNDYMKGIVETNDTEHIEKNKVMALLSKMYALFYMHPDHRHPSVPASALYNAVDDARIFQKYVGAGLEKTLKRRYQALEETKNELVLFDGYVPLLPYYNCSAGFTRSAQEKWGWTDTPYLQTVYDPMRCTDFNGHGIGLSGRGAQRWASTMGKKYDDIIQYYYPGVEVRKM